MRFSLSLLLPAFALLPALSLAHPDQPFIDTYRQSFSSGLRRRAHGESLVPRSFLHRRSSGSGKKCRKRSKTSSSSSKTTAKTDGAYELLARPSSSRTSSSPSPSSSAAKVFSSSAASASTRTLIGYKDPKCGSSGAAQTTDKGTGPNGSEEWLNCGVDDGSGWSPPSLKFSQLRTVSLSTALTQSDSVYAACEAYAHLFEKYGAQNGLPPILLSALAMQESSCNPSTIGDSGGAFGLMQITEDKCGSAPNGDCSDPEYNVETAAAYFAQTLKSHDGDVLLTLGAYNGWYEGLTYSAATAAASGSCCECQNNLDYHHQMLNGWLLGRDGSQLGTVKNLAVCSS
ncbi:hypothetical protein JCM8097_005329 [Rhodosporidiobolus ruineniae]